MAGGRGRQRQLGLPDLTGRSAPKSARPLPARQPVPGEGGEWYAVTDDGDSALRIRSGLHIGETERGALVFNDGLEERRWVVLRITPDGGCIVEAADGHHRLVDEDGNSHSRYALVPGATLAFPGNTLRISKHIARPAQPGPRLAVESGSAPAAANATEPAADARVSAAAGYGGAAELETAPLEPLPEQAEAEPAAARALPVGRWKTGAGVAAGGALFVALLIWPVLREPPNGPFSAAVVEPATAPVEPVEIPPLARRSVPLTPIDLDDLPSRRVVPAAAAVSAAEAPASNAGPTFAAELARARDLLEAGSITYPPNDNAVAVLNRILEREPGHPQALALLGECTTRLIDAAIEAREQGMEYQARNLLEEVRGFNPDNERANRLWQEWMR